MKHATAFQDKLRRAEGSSLIFIPAILLYLILEIPRQITGFNSIRIVQGIILSVIVIRHGSRRYGLNTVLFMILLTFGISWITESLSIMTSYPFGNYSYSELLGTKIGEVPWGIMPAYFLTGYLSWSISSTFLNNYSSGLHKKDLVLTPLIASVLMVMWDFCFEPIHSTIDGFWIWEKGGPVFGIPVSNYAGWFVTVYLIFQIFAVRLYKASTPEPVNQNRIFWYIPPVMYLGIALEFILNPFFKSGNGDIYWTTFLGTILTMVFAALLNIIQLGINSDRYNQFKS